MKHVRRALTIFGAMFFLPLHLSNEKEKSSLFGVQLQWPVSKEPTLQGNNFHLNFSFLRVYYHPWIVCIEQAPKY